jgi:hypothetical protein
MSLDSIRLTNTLEKKRYFNYDLMCTEFTIYSALNQFDQSDPFLFAQSFSNRIHAWWPTAVSLEKYIKSVNTVLQSIMELTPATQIDAATITNCYQPPWHVYFYMHNYQIEHLYLKDDNLIRIEPLEDFIKSHGSVRMCRIALPGTDFYYDIEPHENSIRRAGLVTSTIHDALIFKFMASTHAQVVPENPIKAIVKEILTCRSST